jgi:ABC-type molybdenum transport system ATPase subunit/photorepair protein PhrA
LAGAKLMPSYPDAIGYVTELRDQESTSWFSMICDIAISSSGIPLSTEELDSLVSVFMGKQQYTPKIATPLISPSGNDTSSSNLLSPYHLKSITDFNNFKKLSNDLKINFEKRITLIFGCNGSGKTSLCEAIKLLAVSENPKTPTVNVRDNSESKYSFNFQFNNDEGIETQDSSSKLGRYSDRIKYFDSTIAIQNIENSVEPDKIVKIEPFRFEIFTFVGQFTRELNNYILNMIESQRKELTTEIALTQAKFQDDIAPNKGSIFTLTNFECSELERYLTKFLEIDEKSKNKNIDNISALEKLKAVRSKEGVKLQQTEKDLLIDLGHKIKDFLKLYQSSSLKKSIELSKSLSLKKQILQELAKEITPDGVSSSHFQGFIKASKNIFDYESSENITCPFCRRLITEESFKILKSYHDFLEDKIGLEVSELTEELKEAFLKLKKVKSFVVPSFNDSLPLDQELLDLIKTNIEKVQGLIPAHVNDLEKGGSDDFDDVSDLKKAISVIAKQVIQRYRAVKLSLSDDESFQKQYDLLTFRINQFKYQSCFQDNIVKIKTLVSSINQCNILEKLVNDAGFSGILRKITNKKKEAFSNLVVTEFKNSLNDEYKRISGMEFSHFGLAMNPRGSDQTVIVETQVGSQPIQRVYSEGEQKLHALALFFSETVVSNHSILVFDDPVTSFDYNYSGMYAGRLRDYITDNPDVQVVILTHNWDFFVNLQIILNQSGFNSQLSIQVLENCSIAEEYSEKVHVLKSDIESTLDIAREPTSREKNQLFGNLRRLIESIVNEHVFNNERHQFKQKTLSISVFNKFTKLVPLLPEEAVTLRDLFRKFSPSEHDDPRNYYSTFDKSTFRHWYDNICEIENAIIARKPYN